MAMEPWRFTIEFDEEKAKRNGYNVDDLYDCVGKYAEQMGNVRIGLGTWQAKNRKVQFGAQCPVCATLSKQPWVMQNIKSWRTYEDMNEPEGEDYLQVIRDISPERIGTTERPEQSALEKAPVKWPGLSFPEIDDCFALSSYFVAPQEEHLYPVVTVSSHASRTCTCSS
jgi:hypothetical protein